MNLLSMLTFAAPEQKRVTVRLPDARKQYQRILSGQWLTVVQVAEKFGYTVAGTRATLSRYARRGLVIRRPLSKNRNGRDPFEYTWSNT